jgi:uncharacterized protein (TIGR00730 family)|tara:strand:- start:1928 stop:2539 length:612 start_codon:yes stop_codon:yes gene_type:complete
MKARAHVMNTSTKYNALSVFCGSSIGSSPTYSALAYDLGQYLAKNKVTLVFGGSNVGLMGILSDSVIEAGGEAVGVYPSNTFSMNVSHQKLSKLHLVESMHERKTLMYELSDGAVALPGGFGTLEELTETLTWTQLGIHSLPTALLGPQIFWQSFVKFLDVAHTEGFIKEKSRGLLKVATDPQNIFKALDESLEQINANMRNQ